MPRFEKPSSAKGKQKYNDDEACAAEFGKLVKIQKPENQNISHIEVFAERRSDRQLLVPAIPSTSPGSGRRQCKEHSNAGQHAGDATHHGGLGV